MIERAPCSHDPGGTSCHATPACRSVVGVVVPVEGRAGEAPDRALNEVSPVDEGPSLPVLRFATLALNKVRCSEPVAAAHASPARAVAAFFASRSRAAVGGCFAFESSPPRMALCFEFAQESPVWAQTRRAPLSRRERCPKRQA